MAKPVGGSKRYRNLVKKGVPRKAAKRIAGRRKGKRGKGRR